jgi:uncharacterized protein
VALDQPPPHVRAIPSDFDRETVRSIDLRLADVEVAHGVTIAIAVESGSRAWGFASPDSDFDCRFLFVRRADDYVSPWQKRDVIETPLDAVFDVNGWEIGKALKLLLKGNAVIIEWLMSPVVYKPDQWLRDELLGLADRHVPRDAIARHYLHLGLRQRRTYFADHKNVALKKIFYALRPACALRWMRIHEHAAIAPMHMPTLLDQSEPPPEVRAAVHALIETKASVNELGIGAIPEPIRMFIDSEFDFAEARWPAAAVRVSEPARSDAETVFRRAVARYGASTRAS